MPSSFDVATSTGSYGVAIAPGALGTTLGEGGERVYMVDAFLADRVRAAGVDPIVIKADEGAKSLDRMTELVVAMRERRATRNTVLVAVGGGVVQDAAAFVASIYMRGLDWVYVPTTLLSMTDSCIGGKSSINVGKYKNIVGTIHPPVRVVVDPTVAETLSVEQRAAGLCEAVKICLCRGPEAFHAYLALSPSPAMPADALAKVMALSLGAKKWFIEIDEFDKAERLLLNFGHTFGHALEAASGFGVSHGIAVGLGMLAALHLGEAMGRDYACAPHVAAFRAHVTALVGSVDGLADVLAGVEVSALIDAFESDKKHARDRYAVIIVTQEGAVERRFVPRDADSAALIERAFGAMLRDWTGPHAAPIRGVTLASMVGAG